MSIADLQQFIVECLQRYDSDLDTSTGSQADQQIIQPLLRRIGVDPFTVDVRSFIQQRLLDEFPQAAIKDGDALSELVVNLDAVLIEPLTREIDRIKRGQSFRNPELLTLDEAEALGFNTFSDLDRGQVAKGYGRIYFASPQDAQVTPVNFFRSKTSLRFYPVQTVSIRKDEMVFNLEGNLYYLDVYLRAEQAGDEYNIGPDELVSIAATFAAVRVTNKRAFKEGTPPDTAESFVARIQTEIGERSTTTARGIIAQVPKVFPEVTSIGVVGFNDPEMQRDVIRGGGAGPILAAGAQGAVTPDGEGKPLSRRIRLLDPDINLFELIGPVGRAEKHFTLTVHGAFGANNPPPVRDLRVRAVVDPQTVDLEEQAMVPAGSCPWTLRARTLELSGIPGGILFPNTPFGTVVIPDGEVHIGGMVDTYIRTSSLDQGTLIIDALVDENPLRSGTKAEAINTSGQVQLKDFVVGTDYAEGDELYQLLETAAQKQHTLQILEGPEGLPGSYRIISVFQTVGAHPIVTVSPHPLVVSGDYRWRLLDIIDVELADPKELKVEGSDLTSVQNADFVESASGTDFNALGVGAGDVVRIHNGADADDYKVKGVLAPFYTRIQIDRKLRYSSSGLQYSIFKPNASGVMSLPLVRITSIDLLDTGGQPTGAKVPYALPVDVQSQAFSNPGKGVKWETRDAVLGLCSRASLAEGIPNTFLDGGTLEFQYTWLGAPHTTVVGFSFPVPGVVPIEDVAAAIAASFPYPDACILVREYPSGPVVGLGVRPTPEGGRVTLTAGTVASAVFPNGHGQTTGDVFSASVGEQGGWAGASPPIDGVLDIIDVLEGYQIGHYGRLTASIGSPLITTADREFTPEFNRLVRVGARSLGTARAYFLEPTSLEIDDNTRFSATLADGSEVVFKPDPSLSYQKIPALPNGAPAKDGVVLAGSGYLQSSSTDFIRFGIRAGDKLVITYQPFRGSVALADPVPNIVGLRLVISLSAGTDKEIVFVRDSTAIDAAAVTRAGIARQINQTVGQTICSIVQDGANYYLEFDADLSIVVRAYGTANAALGFVTTQDSNNRAALVGEYTVADVDVDKLYAVTAGGGNIGDFANSYERQRFRVVRPGAQRIVATAMSSNVAETGLYYWDMELVSEGTGDLWNIPAGVQLVGSNIAADGYWLTTPDSSLSFSAAEKPVLHLSRSILEVGTNDDPSAATQLAGQKIRINYEYSNTTGSVGSFLRTDEARVINRNPLARHLIPHFVRLDFYFQGFTQEATLLSDFQRYMTELLSSDYLEASDLIGIATRRGATSVTSPLTLLAVVHDIDRTIKVTRSQNRLNIGRLAAFIPDVINIKRV